MLGYGSVTILGGPRYQDDKAQVWIDDFVTLLESGKGRNLGEADVKRAVGDASMFGGVGPGVPFVHDGTLVISMALARAISPSDAEELESGLVALHRAGSDNIDSIRKAAGNLDQTLARLQSQLSPRMLRGRETQLLREILGTGAEGNYVDYISAEQAFMAVQMLVIQIDDPGLEDYLDQIADTLNDDERYRPAQFAAMLATLSNPEPESKDEPSE